jgi:hypothetical protein
MSDGKLGIALELKDIYKLLCPDCKEQLEVLVKGKLQDNIAKSLLEGK